MDLTISCFLCFVFCWGLTSGQKETENEKYAFETWKFRDYQDYDLVKWGIQRGICPKNVGFCNEVPKDPLVVKTPTEAECRLRRTTTSQYLKNIMYNDVFCGVTCSIPTDCAPDENCCVDPCGMRLCTKVDDYIPQQEQRCPALLFQCRNKFKCLRTDQLCNGVNDCGDNSDERNELCTSENVPVFEHGIQNVARQNFLDFIVVFVASLVFLINKNFNL